MPRLLFLFALVVAIAYAIPVFNKPYAIGTDPECLVDAPRLSKRQKIRQRRALLSEHHHALVAANAAGSGSEDIDQNDEDENKDKDQLQVQGQVEELPESPIKLDLTVDSLETIDTIAAATLPKIEKQESSGSDDATARLASLITARRPRARKSTLFSSFPHVHTDQCCKPPISEAVREYSPAQRRAHEEGSSEKGVSQQKALKDDKDLFDPLSFDNEDQGPDCTQTRTAQGTSGLVSPHPHEHSCQDANCTSDHKPQNEMFHRRVIKKLKAWRNKIYAKIKAWIQNIKTQFYWEREKIEAEALEKSKTRTDTESGKKSV